MVHGMSLLICRDEEVSKGRGVSLLLFVISKAYLTCNFLSF